MGLTTSMDHKVENNKPEETPEEELDWELGIDDADIDMYIMTEDETKYKDGLWNKVNATYLKEQKGKFFSFHFFLSFFNQGFYVFFYCFKSNLCLSGSNIDFLDIHIFIIKYLNNYNKVKRT